MKKLNLVLIFVVAVMLLLMAVSCGKKSTEPDDGIPNFQDFDQFWEYCENFEQAMLLVCEKEGDNLSVWVGVYAGPDLSPDDTLSLVINNQTIPVEVCVDEEEVYLAINDGDNIELPNSKSLAIKFTRNNKDIVNTSIRVPSFPTLQELPETINWKEPVTIKWSLTPNKNNRIQSIGVSVGDYYDYEYYDKMIDVSARQYTIPANTFSLDDVEYYNVDILEANLKTYGDCILIAICGEEISSYEYYESLRNGKRFADRMRKMRHQQKD